MTLSLFAGITSTGKKTHFTTWFCDFPFFFRYSLHFGGVSRILEMVRPILCLIHGPSCGVNILSGGQTAAAAESAWAGQQSNQSNMKITEVIIPANLSAAVPSSIWALLCFIHLRLLIRLDLAATLHENIDLHTSTLLRI